MGDDCPRLHHPQDTVPPRPCRTHRRGDTKTCRLAAEPRMGWKRGHEAGGAGDEGEDKEPERARLIML